MAKRKRREKAYVPTTGADDRGWMTVWAGSLDPMHASQAFQLDINARPRRVQSNWAVFACQTLIAGDIAKLRISLTEKKDGVWQEAESVPYDKLFRKPNGYQIWQQFIEFWSLSKQRRGNSYVLIERDRSTRPAALHVLDPDRVEHLIAPDGSVYYRLHVDDLAGVPEGDVVVPASEVMHDRFNCFFHPLVGLSPLFAGALAAMGGLTMQEEAQRFFRNGARPGGILVAPTAISTDLAKQYKTEWETNYSGANAGRTAVLGNGLKYEAIRETAVDSEIVALLKMSAEIVCTVHHVPAYKVGVGAMPTYQNAEILNQIYYDDCLQKLIEAIEGLLDDGLELYNVDGRKLRAQFDLDGLLRMDTATKIKTLGEAVARSIMAPDEARARVGLAPVPGGKYPLAQQQNFSLEALSKRDESADPFGTAKPEPAPEPPPGPSDAEKGAGNVVRVNFFKSALKKRAA
jgi:HK97 family phage portal protein